MSEIVCKCGNSIEKHYDYIPNYSFDCELTRKEIELISELKLTIFERDALRKQLEESNAKLEYVLAKLYSRDCNSFEHVSVSLAIAHLCDEELDRSGALLGRVRDKAYALAEIEKVKDE